MLKLLILKNTVFYDVTCLDLVRTDVSEERIVSTIILARRSELEQE
jgi:hypothetical protein